MYLLQVCVNSNRVLCYIYSRHIGYDSELTTHVITGQNMSCMYTEHVTILNCVQRISGYPQEADRNYTQDILVCQPMQQLDHIFLSQDGLSGAH